MKGQLADYKLSLMPKDELGEKTIYLENTERKDGLRYSFIGLDEKHKNGIILWDQLPEGVPKDPSEIIKDAYLPNILEVIREEYQIGSEKKLNIFHVRNNANHKAINKNFSFIAAFIYYGFAYFNWVEAEGIDDLKPKDYVYGILGLLNQLSTVAAIVISILSGVDVGGQYNGNITVVSSSFAYGNCSIFSASNSSGVNSVNLTNASLIINNATSMFSNASKNNTFENAAFWLAIASISLDLLLLGYDTCLLYKKRRKFRKITEGDNVYTDRWSTWHYSGTFTFIVIIAGAVMVGLSKIPAISDATPPIAKTLLLVLGPYFATIACTLERDRNDVEVEGLDQIANQRRPRL